MAEVIDVIVPVYNNAEGLIRCVNSLDNQSIDRDLFKVVIVDDGSNEEIDTALFENYNLNIVFKRHKKNYGLPSALNTALEISSSRYFVRVDSDDFVHEAFLYCLLLSFVCDNSLAAVACDYKLVDEFENFISNESAREHPIGCGIMFKRTVLKKIGLYDTKFLLAEEIDFINRFNRYYSMQYLGIPLYRYTQHDKSLTSNSQEYDKFKNLAEIKKNATDAK
ncbi:glycosyltransferase family 2 protein [Amylibacter sp.]|nr:glycosyltransferase family 2 protein [Amylibacter sp.]